MKLVETRVINEMKSKIRDEGIKIEGLFLSNAYRRFLIRQARYITTRNVDVRFDLESETAYATKDYIGINPLLNILETKKIDFESQTLINEGFLAHEIFHHLFTDFSLLKEISVYKGNQQLLQIVNNILEDSFIEWLGCILFPGDFKYAILNLNKIIFEKSNDLEKAAHNPINMMLMALSSFGSTGKINGEMPKEHLSVWEEVRAIMVKGRKEMSPLKRFNLSLSITKILEKAYSTDDVDDPSKKKSYGASDSTGGKEKLTDKEIEEMLESMSADDIHDLMAEALEGDSEGRELSDRAMEILDEKGVKSPKPTKGTESDGSSDIKPGEAGSTSEGDGSSTDSGSSGDGDGSSTESKSDSKKGDSSIDSDKARDLKSGDKDFEEKKPKESTGRTKEEAKRLFESLEAEAKDEVTEEAIERLKTEAIKGISDAISYGEIHKSVMNEVSSHIKYNPVVESMYQEIVEKHQRTIDITKRKFKKILKSAKQTEFRKQRLGRFNVRDVDQLFVDGKVFNRNRTFNGLDVVFTILVDESGSMGGYREISAREAAVVFQEVCEQVNIPVMVLGFDAQHGYEVAKHEIYKHFDTPKSLKHNTARIRAKVENRDGYSIRFASDVMDKRFPDKNKVLVVISDGAPYHGGTSYSCRNKRTTTDMVDQIRRAERKLKTDVIAVNISEHEGLHKAYYKSVVEVPDIESLPDKLVTILKKEFKKHL